MNASTTTFNSLAYYFKGFKLFVVAVAILLTIYITAIWYQLSFAHLYGLDSNTPEFDTYWMTWLYAELVIEAIVATCLWSYIWVTRELSLESVKPNEELQRYFTFSLFLAVYAWTLYWGVSYFTEQDGAWHQVVTRDTSFTPSHIMIFYLSFPLYIIAGVATLLYAQTRLPIYHQEGLSLAHVILVTGPFMILPNVGLNEWGHAFWFMEEFFSAPLHWGFVILGWCGLGLCGVILQIIERVSSILQTLEKQSELTEVDS